MLTYEEFKEKYPLTREAKESILYDVLRDYLEGKVTDRVIEVMVREDMAQELEYELYKELKGLNENEKTF
jgi:hypothetical protein